MGTNDDSTCDASVAYGRHTPPPECIEINGLEDAVKLAVVYESRLFHNKCDTGDIS